MKKHLWLEACCALLIILWLYASLSKFISLSTFQHDIYNQPFPRWFASIILWSLIPIEISIAGLLLFEKTRRTGLLASLTFISIFTIYTVAILMGAFHHMPCGCGGVIRNLSWREHLVFNLFFSVVSVAALILHKNNDNQKSIVAFT